MRHSWRIALALAALYCGTTANAQAVGPPANALGGADPNGGISQPGGPDAELKDSGPRMAPPAQQRSAARFGRVALTRQETVVSAPPDVVGRLGGTATAGGVVSQGTKLHPYSAQAAMRAGTSPDPRIPVGSSGQEFRRPAPRPSITVKSTTHNYYPNMRRAMGPNANVPPVRARRGGVGGVGGAAASGAVTGMMMRGMMGGTQRPAARSGQAAPSRRGQAGLASGGR